MMWRDAESATDVVRIDPRISALSAARLFFVAQIDNLRVATGKRRFAVRKPTTPRSADPPDQRCGAAWSVALISVEADHQRRGLGIQRPRGRDPCITTLKAADMLRYGLQTRGFIPQNLWHGHADCKIAITPA